MDEAEAARSGQLSAEAAIVLIVVLSLFGGSVAVYNRILVYRNRSHMKTLFANPAAAMPASSQREPPLGLI